MAKFSKIFIFNQIFKNVQFWQVNEFQDSLPEVLKGENLTMKLVQTHFTKIKIFKNLQFWQVNEFRDSLPEVLKRENLTMKLIQTRFKKIMIFKKLNFWSGGLLKTLTVTLFLQNPSVFFLVKLHVYLPVWRQLLCYSIQFFFSSTHKRLR